VGDLETEAAEGLIHFPRVKGRLIRNSALAGCTSASTAMTRFAGGAAISGQAAPQSNTRRNDGVVFGSSPPPWSQNFAYLPRLFNYG
jgi:hypothetical protein